LKDSFEAGIISKTDYNLVNLEIDEWKKTRMGISCAFPLMESNSKDFITVSLLTSQFHIRINPTSTVKDIKVFLGQNQSRDPKSFRLLDENGNELLVIFIVIY
jgi:hypothetical protein